MPEDDHIIQIDDAIGQIELPKHILHQMLEYRGCITQSKGHPGKFIETKVANHECGVLLQLWGHADLPKSTLKVHHGEVCSSCHVFQIFLYPGKGIRIFLCPHIEVHTFNAELKGSIFLPHQYHCITPGRLAKSNSTSIQHISKGCTNLFQQRQKNAPKCSLKGLSLFM